MTHKVLVLFRAGYEEFLEARRRKRTEEEVSEKKKKLDGVNYSKIKVLGRVRSTTEELNVFKRDEFCSPEL